MGSILFLSLLISNPVLGTEVACTELAFGQSAERRDLETFAGFLDPDARFTGGDVLRGPEAITEGWSAFFDPQGPLIRWAPDSVEVLGSGDLALSQGPYEIHSTGTDGSKTLRVGRFMSVWRRGGQGSWSIVFDGGTPSQPAEAGLVDAAQEQLLPLCTSPPEANSD